MTPRASATRRSLTCSGRLVSPSLAGSTNVGHSPEARTAASKWRAAGNRSVSALIHTTGARGCRSLRRGNLQRIVSTFVLLVVAVAVSASDKTVTFQIPPVRIPLNVKDQRITLVASGVITLTAKKQGANIFDLRLHADLADLQQ